MKNSTKTIPEQILIPPISAKISNKYAFLDTDVLINCLDRQILFKELIKLSSDQNVTFIIDPLVRFEFLSHRFKEKDIENLELFLDSEIFIPAFTNPELSKKISANALTLSRIYAFTKSSPNAKFVDLHLAGRCMLYENKPLLATCNKKDYSSYVFDIEAAIPFLDNSPGNGNIRNISFLSVNFDKIALQNDLIKKSNTPHS